MGPDQDVRALRDGDGAFCILAHGDARNSQCSGFFLKPTTIGNDHSGVLPQFKKWHVGQGREKVDIGPRR